MTAIRTFGRSLQRPTQGVFGDDELAGLPDPVRRMFSVAIAHGTPLATSATLTMRGRIKLKGWTDFSGTEVIAPHDGFVWAVRAGLVSGHDRYIGGEGEMRWKLLGLIPVMRAAGPDVSRSAAGRCGGEGVWIPTALLPRFGVEWSAVDDHHVVARQTLDDHHLEVHHVLNDHGRVTTTWFERWGDPESTGTYGLHTFGVEHTAHRTFAGLTIPSASRAGWWYGTDRFRDDVFFEAEITDLQPSP